MVTCALFGCSNPPSSDNAHCVKHKSLHKPAVMMKGKAIVPKKGKPPKIAGYCVEYATKKGTAAKLCQHVMCYKAINSPVMQLGMICEIDGEDETKWFHLACLFAHLEINRAVTPPMVMKKVVGVETLLATDKDALTALVKMEAAARKILDEQRAKETYLEKESENKFWAISVSGTSTITRWGPIGDTGFETTKELGAESSAKEWMKKKIAEKEAGGYCRIMKIEEHSDSEGEESSMSMKKKLKQEKKKKKQESEDEEEEKEVKKKKKFSSKQSDEEEEEDDESETKKKKKKTMKAKKESGEEEEEEEHSPPPKKKSKVEIIKKKKKAETDSDEDMPPQPPPQKSKKSEAPKKKLPKCPYGSECWHKKDAEHCRNLSH